MATEFVENETSARRGAMAISSAISFAFVSRWMPHSTGFDVEEIATVGDSFYQFACLVCGHMWLHAYTKPGSTKAVFYLTKRSTFQWCVLFSNSVRTATYSYDNIIPTDRENSDS